MLKIKIFIPVLVLFLGVLFFLTKEGNDSSIVESEQEIEEKPGDWMYWQRAYPHNRIDEEQYHAARRQTILAKQKVRSRDLNDWELVGPYNIGGRVTDIALHPTDQDIIYIGTSTGGVFKTIDSGESWTPIFDNAGSLSIGNLALDPQNPETIYVGTGEANGSATSGAFFGDGIYKSTNGGATWEHIGLESSQHIGRIVVDPQNSNRIFAAVAGTLYEKGNNRGLYRTEDGGQSWSNILFVSDSTSCIDVAVHPQNPNIVYAATWERIRYPYQRDYGGPTSGLHRSMDGGNTWTQLENGLPPSTDQTGRIGITISASDPNVLYATFTTNPISNQFEGIYKTTNGGDNWIQTNDDELVGLYASFGWFFGNIRVDPNNPDIVYAMGVTNYRSLDGGQSWEYFLDDNMHVDFHAWEVHPQNSNRIVVGNDGGVYISDDMGQTWEHPQLPITQFYECTIDNSLPYRYYGGTQDNNTIRTLTGDGDDWDRIIGGDGFHVIVDPTDNQRIYGEYQFGGLQRSEDGGNNFFSATEGIDPADRQNWNTPVVMDPSNPNVLYYGSNRLYRTTNYAQNWTAISDDLTNGLHPSGSGSFGTLTAIAVAPSELNTIYIGTDDGNVQVTFDGGTSWTNISADLPDRYVTEVAVDYDNPQIAYVTFSGYKYIDYMPHVLRTTNGGTTWEDISGNLPEIPINDIIIDPVLENTFYIANDMGVWYTIDDGVSWDILSPVLPTTVVNDLSFHPATRTLVAATFGRSLYKVVVDETIAAKDLDKVEKASLTIFPNPVEEKSTIQFTLAEQSKGVLQAIDLSGRLVETIYNKDFSIGQNEVIWDASALPNGQYIIRLQTENMILTKKVSVLH